MATTGDSTRLKGSIYNYAKSLADPENPVTVKIYSHIGNKLLETGEATRETTGIYYYDYAPPEDIPGDLVYEFATVHEGKPQKARAILKNTWLTEPEE